MNLISKFTQAAGIGLILVASLHANAQSVRTVGETYTSGFDLPIAPAVTAPKSEKWTVELKDVNLANTLMRWATQAGWRLRWDAEKLFLVDAPDVFQGTFEQVVEELLSTQGIAQSTYPLEVCFYSNTPPLARVTRRGDQTKECK